MIQSFHAYREKMNERLLAQDNKVIKRIFNLDTNAYLDGTLTAMLKVMLGVASSMVRRCDDCVKYHLDKCLEHRITTEEIMEIFAMANLIGGTIVIPHTGRSLEYWEELKKQPDEDRVYQFKDIIVLERLNTEGYEKEN